MSDQLKYRLSQFEATPPPHSWDGIADSLDELNELKPVSDRLSNLSIDPPVDQWNKISHLLDNPVPETLAPVKKMKFPYYRLAAAAVIGVVLISGLWKLLQPSDIALVINGSNELQKTPDKSSILPGFNNVAKTDAELRNSATSLEPVILRVNVNNSDPVLKRAVQYASIEGSRLLREDLPIIIDPKPINNSHADRIRNLIIGNYYLTIKAPNGEPTRISSKFGDIIGYLYNDEELMNAAGNAPIGGSDWKRIFSEWRNKIMQSPYKPASENFLDIAEFRDFIIRNNQ